MTFVAGRKFLNEITDLVLIISVRHMLETMFTQIRSKHVSSEFCEKNLLKEGVLVIAAQLICTWHSGNEKIRSRVRGRITVLGVAFVQRTR